MVGRTLAVAALAALAGCDDGDPGLTADAAVGEVPDADPASGWRGLAPLVGGPRQETAVVELGGEIYVLGGFDASIVVSSAVAAYDPVTDSWRAVAALPAARHHCNAAAVGGKLYVLGCLSGSGFVAHPEVYVYDPAADGWSQGTPMPAGSERGSAAVAAIGSVIYVAGGQNGGATVATASTYETAGAGVWSELPELPSARNHLVGAAVDGVFYAIGGRSGSITALSGEVDAYDPTLGTWAPRHPMTTARGGAAAGVVGGRILVVGGEGNAAAASGVFAQNEAYDPVADTWTALEPMRTPRHGTGAAGLGASLYVPGGATEMAFGAVATVEAFTP